MRSVRSAAVSMQIKPRCGHFSLQSLWRRNCDRQLDILPPPQQNVQDVGMERRERERQLRAIKLPQVRSNPTLDLLNPPAASSSSSSRMLI